MAPVAFAAPLLAGLAADAWGFRAVFAMTGVFGLAALLLLVARVRNPRHTLAKPPAREYT